MSSWNLQTKPELSKSSDALTWVMCGGRGGLSPWRLRPPRDRLAGSLR